MKFHDKTDDSNVILNQLTYIVLIRHRIGFSPEGEMKGVCICLVFSAQSFGLPYLSAYLDAVGSNFSHGANFATAGSTIRPQNTTLHQSGFSPISLDVQFNEFYEFRRRSQVARTRGIRILNLKEFLYPKTGPNHLYKSQTARN